ncbi:H/ACA ribonucleoprotein complex non-core subunit NAF1 [Zerene cesonia]|uniref:H/ACA ribonucleoprotein complex non-core subunit NAF1 n=1 Tax=Zerene cesonia TaxID=33412 RepID=UPI0018E4FD3F|nr:H/ACA ribonucleoprotein complex non-core subunit NAF1 [Zerene cesonia]
MENLDQSSDKNVSLSLIAEYRSDSESEETPSNENAGENTDGDSDTVELSEMVLKNNIINACAHGPLSNPKFSNNIEVTTHMIIDNSENGISEYDVTMYRVDDEDSESDSDSDSSDDSSDSDVDSVKDIEELSSGDEVSGNTGAEKIVQPKVHGELDLDDLPPIEDLTISLPAQETTKIGKIFSIVDRLVVVQAFPDTPAVDIDSVLFLDNGAKALGKVFDVFGPVTEPHYCVRFNSTEHIKERGVEVGMDVFIAPRTNHTSYVFLSELMKVKGSDASWLNDIEPPPSQVEFSDDEEERKARREKKQSRQQEGSENGETSKNPPRKMLEARRNRPSQSTSRFRPGPNRGYNFYDNRAQNPFMAFNGSRPDFDRRIPPPHPMSDSGVPLSAPPGFTVPMYPPPFPRLPPRQHFGRNPLLQTPNMPPFRQNMPVFGSNYCNMPGPQPQWLNRPPPPPGT